MPAEFVSFRLRRIISITVLMAAMAGCGNTDPESAVSSRRQVISPAEPRSEPNSEKSIQVGYPTVSTTGPWPRIDAASRTFDFGRMPAGDSIGIHKFRIRNTGEADLELKAGEASCECTSFKIEDTRVPPGGETNVVVQWNMSTPSRSFRHGGSVYSNDPGEKLIRFEVEGVIDDAVIVEPSLVWDAGTLLRDRDTPLEIRVASSVYTSFQIESLTAGTQFLRFDTRPMTSAELGAQDCLSGYIITAFFSEKLPPGSFQDRVTMKLSMLSEPRVFEIRAIRTGPIRFLPVPGELFDPEKMLFRLGNFRAAQGRQGKIMMIADHERFEDPLQISVEDGSPSFLRASLQPQGTRTSSMQRYLLTVEIPPGQEAYDSSASPAFLKIRTNHPELESFLLTLSFISN
jgi:hypothetical protein